MSNSSSGLEEIGPEEANALIEGGAYLLDVREPDEWAAGRAPSAHHIPLGELGERHHEVPIDAVVVCVCRGGGRSARAAEAFTGAGWKAINLAGGMRAWEAAGLPVVTEEGAVGQVI
jgi:rhodanese-related sulfurtransferase